MIVIIQLPDRHWRRRRHYPHLGHAGDQVTLHHPRTRLERF